MATLGNSTCVKLKNVERSGFNYEAPWLYIKGSWFPSDFSVSICDGVQAWTGTVSQDAVATGANELHITELEYIDRAHSYFSKQHPDMMYELSCGKKLSAELICHIQSSCTLGLRITLKEVSIQTVAVGMFQFLMDAHMLLSEEMARGVRNFERMIAAKEQSLTLLRNEKLQLEEEIHILKGDINGQPKIGPYDKGLKFVEDSRGKRKGMVCSTETGSRKRNSQGVGPSEPSPVSGYQKAPSPEYFPSRDHIPIEEQSPSTRLPLSLLGYKQPKVGEESPLDASNYGSWIGKDLTAIYNVKESPVEIAKKSTGKKQKKSGGSRSNKKQTAPSVEASLDLVDDIVEKGIQLVETLGSPNILGFEVSSPLTTPVKQCGKTPTARKSPSKSSSKVSSSRKSKKTAKKVEVETSLEVSEEPEVSAEQELKEVSVPVQAVEERVISVQNAEFHDFDEKRTEMEIEVDDFWALFDDHDGMPRFYGRILEISRDPFQVSVEWLEPLKPTLPASGLVKTAGLSAGCGDFKVGTVCLQDLPAFSHKVEVQDEKKGIVKILPTEGEVWALYRYWDKKQVQASDEEVKYDYDLVTVQSNISTREGLKVVPLVKVAGFKSLFETASKESTHCIPYKQIQARFSHRIPESRMCGSESPGVPVGALELDPASTPAEYLGKPSLEGIS